MKNNCKIKTKAFRKRSNFAKECLVICISYHIVVISNLKIVYFGLLNNFQTIKII